MSRARALARLLNRNDTIEEFTSTGINDNATSTTITIDASENVGIGTTNPSEKLDVSGNILATGTVTASGGDSSNWNTAYGWGDHSAAGYLTSTGIDDNATSTAMTIDSSGNVGIGTTSPSEKLNVSGNILATGNVTAYSDARLKSDVETLDGSKVYEMRGVSFTKNGEASSGVIAQELQKVAPELVNESGEYLSVAYGNIVGYLIEAVKDLKAEIEELKNGASN